MRDYCACITAKQSELGGHNSGEKHQDKPAVEACWLEKGGNVAANAGMAEKLHSEEHPRALSTN